MTPPDPSKADPVVGPLSGAEVAALRADTPGTRARAHLNNAGAGLMSAATLATVIGHLEAEAHLGGYEAAEAAADALTEVRVSAAELLGAAPGEVAVTTSDTAAWAKAFWGFVAGGGLADRPRIVVDRVTYNSHWFAVLQAAKHQPLDVTVVGPGPDGTLDLVALERALTEPTALVSITHVPTHSGVVAPVEAVGELARASGAVYALDTCQAVGQLPVDVTAIGCDLATATGRKWLRGPRGTGLSYVTGALAERLDPPGIDATSASWSAPWSYELAPGAGRFEDFEGPVAAQLGLGVAIDEALAVGVDRLAARIDELAGYLRRALDALPGTVVTDGDGRRSGIVTFASEHRRPDEIVAAATAAGINIGTSRAATALLDLGPRGLDEVVRVSPHAYNTLDELDALLELM